MHLIIAKYDSDAERKRIEYVLDKWKETLRITKPEGIISIVEGEELESLLEDLYSRTTKRNVTLYKVEKQTVDLESTEGEIKIKFNDKKETIEKLVSFIMARQKAVLKRETKEPFERVYEVITKKGRAEISLLLVGEGQAFNLLLRITGYGEVVQFVKSRLEEEFRYAESR
jgi:hypothetical protein